MKSASIACVSFFALIGVCAAMPDYCVTSLCPNSTHIGCGNNGDLGAACPGGSTKMMIIGEVLRAKIVNIHNKKRSLLARGALPGFSPAERMPTIKWNSELAYLAALNVRTCVYAHDACRNTNAFNNSGQSLGKSWWFQMVRNDEDVLTELFEAWWNEKANAKQSDLDKYPYTTSMPIGHFAMMASDKNIAVGCAGIKFPENGMSTLTLACNYATANVLGRPVYKSGVAASKCLTGSNPSYSGLCSSQETVNPNALFP